MNKDSPLFLGGLYYIFPGCIHGKGNSSPVERPKSPVMDVWIDIYNGGPLHTITMISVTVHYSWSGSGAALIDDERPVVLT